MRIPKTSKKEKDHTDDLKGDNVESSEIVFPKKIYVRKQSKDAENKEESSKKDVSKVATVSVVSEDAKLKKEAPKGTVKVLRVERKDVKEKVAPAKTIVEKAIDIKEKIPADLAELSENAESSENELSDSILCHARTKIDVYLKDSRKLEVKTEPEIKFEEKKQFKTFEEAFLHSITGTNLGRRNASKRNYEQISTGKVKIERISSPVAPNMEVEQELTEPEPVEKKTKTEQIEKKSETDPMKMEIKDQANLEEDIEVLKHQTDEFLQKYKKEKSPTVKADVIKLDILENSKKEANPSTSNTEHNYMSKKKMAAQNLSGQKTSEYNIKEDTFPHDLVEKHKDLGQELIQLTHDIIQQQSSKTHKYLDQSSNGLFNFKPTSDTSTNHDIVSEHNMYSAPVFGETVSSKLMDSINNPSNPMYCKEFGKHSATSTLDFSQLANQADQHSDMNLLFTIHKLSSSLKGQPNTELVQETVSEPVMGTQVKQGNLTVDVNIAENGKKYQNDLKSPTILRSCNSSMKSSVPKKSPRVSPTQATYCQQTSPVPTTTRISPIQTKIPQLASNWTTPTTSLVRIQSPNGIQRQVKVQSQQYSSPPRLSSAESQLLSQNTSPSLKSPPVLSPVVSTPTMSLPSSQSLMHNTMNPDVNVQPCSVATYNAIQSSTVPYNQQIEQRQIMNSQGIGMMPNRQKFMPVVNSTQNQTTIQSVSGHVLNAGQILHPVMLRQQLGNLLQTHSFGGSPSAVLRHQGVQQTQSSGTQSTVGTVITNPQLVTMANQGLVQLGMQGVTSSQANVQPRIVRNGNQTFLLNIPVMGPTTSSISCSVVQVPACNSLVTAALSQGKQNNDVGEIVQQPQTSMLNNLTAAPVFLVAESSGKGMSTVAGLKTDPDGPQNIVLNKTVDDVSGETKSNSEISPQLNKIIPKVENVRVSVPSSAISPGVVSTSETFLNTQGHKSMLLNGYLVPTTGAVVNGTDIMNSNKAQVLVANGIANVKETIVDTKQIKYTAASVEENSSRDDSSSMDTYSPFLMESKSDVSLHSKSLSVSPPPRLQSPNKLMQLVPQPIVPISQTFTSTLSHMKPLFSDSSFYNGAIPSQLLDGEEYEDVKPPILEMEPPMLEMEAPILKLEAGADSVSVKSEPDTLSTLSNSSIGSNSMNISTSLRSDLDGMPVYPMTGNGLDPSLTIIQTTSYNAFSGQGKQPSGRKRRKSAADCVKENKVGPREFIPSPEKV